MLALHVALFVALAPTLPPEPATVDEGCDPAKLAPMISAPKSDIAGLLGVLDRRLQKTLFEERQTETQNAARATEAARLRPNPALRLGLYAAQALALAAALLMARRRSAAGTAAALVVLALLVGVAVRSIELRRALAADRIDGAERRAQLVACRLRLTETRATLEHSLLARCYHDIGEIDEDMLGWQSKVRTGGAVTLDELMKMHGEIMDATR